MFPSADYSMRYSFLPSPLFCGAVFALGACQEREPTLPLPLPRPTVRAVRPNRVPEGTTITITGAHFSPTAAENQVRFNGVAAQVSAATDSTLTTIVPAGVFNYTTGPLVSTVVVTTQGRAGERAGELLSDQAPEFVAVEPATAAAGSIITITGRNLNPAIERNLVIFGSLGSSSSVTVGTIVAATPTSLQVRVPTPANSGKLTVWTDPVTNEPVRYVKTLPFTVVR